jgi:riboflavin biosynthesis pyrimidine reductase
MTEPELLELLVEARRGRIVPLPPRLHRLYGPLRMPTHRGRPHVVANFASTLDGVVSLDPSGRSGGGEITGFDPHDRMVMGLLRAAADAVIVGAGTLRAVPRHRWTPERVYPKLADAYRALRARRRMPPEPLNVVVSASGDLDLGLPVFRSGEVEVLIVTTERGAGRLRSAGLPERVTAVVAGRSGPLSAPSILDAVGRARNGSLLLLEGGPHLLGRFLSDGCLDELFLTLSARVAGRDDRHPRLSLVEGRSFAPERPRPATLIDVRRGGELMMLRYAFDRPAGPPKAPK